jgi:hypothetical protein
MNGPYSIVLTISDRSVNGGVETNTPEVYPRPITFDGALSLAACLLSITPKAVGAVISSSRSPQEKLDERHGGEGDEFVMHSVTTVRLRKKKVR